MANFTSTAGDDNFVATSGADNFYFGENQGVDLIVGFDPAKDKLVYTDRSVDGFDDIGISQLSNGDTAVESNDQVTVLKGIKPSQLLDSDFVFTTSGPRYTITRARENNDVPNEVNVRNINQREAQYSGSSSGTTPTNGSGSSGTGNTGSTNKGGTSHSNPFADFLHRAGLGSNYGSALLSSMGTTSTASAGSVTSTSQSQSTGGSLSSLLNLGNNSDLIAALFHGASDYGRG